MAASINAVRAAAPLRRRPVITRPFDNRRRSRRSRPFGFARPHRSQWRRGALSGAGAVTTRPRTTVSGADAAGQRAARTAQWSGVESEAMRVFGFFSSVAASRAGLAVRRCRCYRRMTGPMHRYASPVEEKHLHRRHSAQAGHRATKPPALASGSCMSEKTRDGNRDARGR